MAYKNSSGGGANPGSNTFVIDPDMLPPGMAEKINKGDILEFKVVEGGDGDGGITVEYNYGEGGGEGEEKEPMSEAMKEGDMGEMKEGETGNWEEDFRKSMSPQNDQSGAY